jgi:methylenetetrahydrofolate reductase (NADPH)
MAIAEPISTFIDEGFSVTSHDSPVSGRPIGAAALIRAANIEIIPLKGAEAKLRALSVGSGVTITCSPKFGLERTLQHVESAARAGFNVIPHLAARQVADRAELEQFVRRVEKAGVTDLYVIGGDADRPAGRYSTALEVLRDLADMDHSLTRLGVACYPEGHPKIDDSVLLEALQAKQGYADYMVSQLCFDPSALVGWLGRVRDAGVHLPTRIGLAAPISVRKLAELSLKIGVGQSLRFLTKQHGLVGNLILGTNSYRPEDLLEAIDPALLADPHQIEGLHLFSFNQIEATAAWQRQVADAA